MLCAIGDLEKEEFYRKHVLTKEERIKTQELRKKVAEFAIKADEDALHSLSCYYRQKGDIHYREGLGYISIVNFDRDEVKVIGYGKTIEDAFLSIIIDYEFYICDHYEWSHRQELNK